MYKNLLTAWFLTDIEIGSTYNHLSPGDASLDSVLLSEKVTETSVLGTLHTLSVFFFKSNC